MCCAAVFGSEGKKNAKASLRCLHGFPVRKLGTRKRLAMTTTMWMPSSEDKTFKRTVGTKDDLQTTQKLIRKQEGDRPGIT
jgi:hypothetical protein